MNIVKAVSGAIAGAYHSVKSVWTTSTVVLSSWFQGLKANWLTPSYHNIAKKIYRNPYAFRGLQVVSDTVASIEVILFRKMRDGKRERVMKSPLLDVLANPGDGVSKYMFCKLMVLYTYLAGEIIIRKYGPSTGRNAGAPRNLRLIRPDRLQQIVRNRETDEIIAYWISDRWGKAERVPAEEIIYIKTFNPLDDDRGFPILLTIMREVELMDEVTDWNKSVAQLRGRIPGFFKYTGKGRFDDIQFKKLKTEAQTAYRKDSRESLPGYLPADVDWIQNGQNMKESDFVEGDKALARKIAVGIGLDPALLGDATNKTYSNFETALKALLLLTSIPLLEWILSELNLKFVPLFPDSSSLELDINRESIDAIQDGQTEVFERLLKATGRPFMAVPEARREANLPEQVQGELWAPINVAPASDLEDVGDPEEEPEDVPDPEPAFA